MEGVAMDSSQFSRSGRRLAMMSIVGAMVILFVACSSGSTSSSSSSSAGASAEFSKINHLIVVYQENWSFDSLYGYFPGANGLKNAGDSVKQVDKDGKPYTTLPQPIDSNLKPAGPDPRFPADLPVAPYDVAKYVQASEKTGDLVHRYY